MVAVIEGSKETDQIDHTDTVEDIACAYRHLVNCDPYKDMLFVEMKDEVIGYARVWWILKSDGIRTYCHFALLLPRWRGQNIHRAMLRHNERRLRKIASAHPKDGPLFFEVWAGDAEVDWVSLLVKEGYKPIRYSFEMLRPNLEDIPDLPLPEALEVRPAKPEHYRTIYRAAWEAFQDHWGSTRWLEEEFEQ